MKRTAKRDRRTKRNQRRKTMRRAVRKSQRRNTMRRKTKRNKRTQQGGMNRFSSAISKRKETRAKKKKQTDQVLKSELMKRLSAASQSLQMANEAGFDPRTLDTLQREVKGIEFELLKQTDGKVIPTFQDTMHSRSLDVLDTVGAVGDVAYEMRDEALMMSRNKMQELMDSFRRGRQMVVDYAAGKGVQATQKMTENAIMLLGALKQMDVYLKSLQSSNKIKPQLMIEDRPQPPQ